MKKPEQLKGILKLSSESLHNSHEENIRDLGVKPIYLCEIVYLKHGWLMTK